MPRRPGPTLPIAMPLSDASDVPAKINIAFRVLGYCRSVTDPYSIASTEGLEARHVVPRKLTALEAGMEASAMNLIRNWLNGEQILPHPETTVPLNPAELFLHQGLETELPDDLEEDEDDL